MTGIERLLLYTTTLYGTHKSLVTLMFLMRRV